MHARFPTPFLEFVARFNQGEFWESHEILESPWRASRSPFYKGLILYASAYVHVQRGNPRGITAQFVKAERHLARYRPSYLGLDVEAPLVHAERCRGLVEAQARTHATDWSTVIPRIRLQPQVALLRGSEPELQNA